MLSSKSLVHFCRQLLDVPLPLLKPGLVGSHAMSPAAATTGSVPVAGGVVTGGGVVAGTGGGGALGAPAAADLSASRYVPPEEVCHSTAGSTLVPSPHSLNVVTSCHGSFEAIMWAMFVDQRAGSRASRAVDSFALLKPGEIEKEYPAWRLSATAGEYWCQESG